MSHLVLIAIALWVILTVGIGIIRDNAWQKGMKYGWDSREKLINLKIRQDAYILDGKRVRKTVDEKDTQAEGFYGGTQEK